MVAAAKVSSLLDLNVMRLTSLVIIFSQVRMSGLDYPPGKMLLAEKRGQLTVKSYGSQENCWVAKPWTWEHSLGYMI